MLAAAGPLPVEDSRWAFEVKWDGLRGLCSFTGDVLLRSRNGTDLTARFPELTTRLAGRTALLDGEVIVADPTTGRPDFDRVSRRLGCSHARAAQLARTEPATFVAFDLLWLDGRSLLDLPYTDRREALDTLGLTADKWVISPIYSSGAALWQAITDHHLEGVVAKRWDSRYRPGRRTSAWVKTKVWQRVD